MKKLVITVPEDMKEALDEISRDTGIPIARLVRDGVKVVLQQHGYKIDTIITRGGNRRVFDDTESK